jgi:hypothetical protein
LIASELGCYQRNIFFGGGGIFTCGVPVLIPIPIAKRRTKDVSNLLNCTVTGALAGERSRSNGSGQNKSSKKVLEYMVDSLIGLLTEI